MSGDTQKKLRINLYFNDEGDEEIYEALAALANKRKRSLNQIAKILLKFALTQKDLLPDDDEM
jgi:hypothetical protein